MLVSEIVTFMSKRKISLRICPKINQKNKKHSLAVCGHFVEKNSLKKKFLPFYWFGINISKFSSGFALSNMIRKTNSLSILVLVSKIVSIMSKEKRSL